VCVCVRDRESERGRERESRREREREGGREKETERESTCRRRRTHVFHQRLALFGRAYGISYQPVKPWSLRVCGCICACVCVCGREAAGRGERVREGEWMYPVY